MQVGDIVKYSFDTGALGFQYLFGVVEQAGPKTFTVRWESDLRNRVRQGNHLVTRVTDPELLAEVHAQPFLRSRSR